MRLLNITMTLLQLSSLHAGPVGQCMYHNNPGQTTHVQKHCHSQAGRIHHVVPHWRAHYLCSRCVQNTVTLVDNLPGSQEMMPSISLVVFCPRPVNIRNTNK